MFYNDHFSSFEELFSKDKSVTVHQRNLQTPATEIYKILNRLSPDIMQDIFEIKAATIILAMRQHFPQEILKQLDMDYRPSLTWLQRYETLHLKR